MVYTTRTKNLSSLDKVARYLDPSSAIHKDEALRRAALIAILERLLGQSIELVQLDDHTSIDGVFTVRLGGLVVRVQE